MKTIFMQSHKAGKTFANKKELTEYLKKKFIEHRNGIALVPDRTSAPWWQEFVPQIDLVLFVSPKIKFIGSDGKPGKSPAQGTCLLGLGKRSREALHRAAANGLGILFEPVNVR